MLKRVTGKATSHCSFCGKSESQVLRLIAGPNRVYICDECVRLCRTILAEDGHDADSPFPAIS